MEATVHDMDGLLFKAYRTLRRSKMRLTITMPEGVMVSSFCTFQSQLDMKIEEVKQSVRYEEKSGN